MEVERLTKALIVGLWAVGLAIFSAAGFSSRVDLRLAVLGITVCLAEIVYWLFIRNKLKRKAK